MGSGPQTNENIYRQHSNVAVSSAKPWILLDFQIYLQNFPRVIQSGHLLIV